MNISLASLGIERMSIADRLTLVEDLWDSIAAQSPVTQAQREELDRRLADHATSPGDVVPWTEVRQSITTRLGYHAPW